MTREEIRIQTIAQLERISGMLGAMGEEKDWTEYAIRALEQESVLDKIRAEIKALSPEPTAYDVVDGNPIKDAVWEILADVLKIIDKYKTGKE